MEIVSIVILCFICALLVVSTYIMIRNYRVYKFQTVVAELAFLVMDDFLSSVKADELVKRYAEYTETDRMIKRITSRSYDRMLYSFKPLKLEYWYSEEEIAFIKKGMKLWKNRKS